VGQVKNILKFHEHLNERFPIVGTSPPGYKSDPISGSFKSAIAGSVINRAKLPGVNKKKTMETIIEDTCCNSLHSDVIWGTDLKGGSVWNDFAG